MPTSSDARDWSELLPLSPPPGTLEYLKSAGGLKREYLIYRAEWYSDPLTGEKTKGVRVTCTACGETWIAEHIPIAACRGYAPAPFGYRDHRTQEEITSGSSALCPECGAEATARHIGSFRYDICNEAGCTTIGKVKDHIVIFQWIFQKSVDKEGRVRYAALPWEAYVVEKKKIIKLRGYMKNINSVTLLRRWRQLKRYSDTHGTTNYLAPIPEGILNGTVCENSKLDMYIAGSLGTDKGTASVAYMKLWQKKPQVENLITSGCVNVVNTALAKVVGSYGYAGGVVIPREINWTEKKPHAMLGVTKEELSCCASGKWTVQQLEMFKKLREQEKVNLVEDTRLLFSMPPDAARIVNSTPAQRGGATIMRTARYLKKQGESAGHLFDFWNMAEELYGTAFTLKDRFPKNLKTEHDRVLEEWNRKRSLEQQEKLKLEILKRAPEFSKHQRSLLPFAYEANGIKIFPCLSEEELIAEGKVLHHCVASYAQRIADCKTSIFFIRKTAAPDTPWFTLELNVKNKTVVQNRGTRNCARTPEIEEFEKLWLDWLKTQGIERRYINESA